MNQNPTNNKFFIYYPLMLAAMLVIGIYVGSYFSSSGGSKPPFFPQFNVNSADKIGQIINFIDAEYVDTIAKNRLIDKAIRAILEDLDPHSYYISAEELAAYTEPLEGNFEGIGVEFLIQDDTVRVVAAIDGGPSAQLGVQPGDRILSVDGESIAGTGVTNEKVISLLKGPRGTEVSVEIKRQKQNIPFKIVRNTIPINSVVTSQMIDSETGFIKIARFARNTHEEFTSHMASLSEQGMKDVIIDLRGNGGGFLTAAVSIAEDFLQKGSLIVYTEGKASPKQEYFANKKGQYAGLPVAILINEGSASASEILAGALQDNDRGILIGRRTFGKGLVQEHLNLSDKSALRLTVARYYTPTGRSIQKPYGGDINYEEDYNDRVAHGEFLSADSIHFPDSLQFTTPGGRIVYGGGGIMPDIFVSVDTLGASAYLNVLSYQGIINQFGFDYADQNRADLLNYGSYRDFKSKFQVNPALLRRFAEYAAARGVQADERGMKLSEYVIKLRIKAYIARNIWGNDGFYAIMNEDDNVLKEAVKALQNPIGTI